MLTITPVPARIWTRVILTVLFVVLLGAIASAFYFTVQDSHNRVCKAVEENRQFIKDTDAYILRHTTHPKDPAILGFHNFLLTESKGTC